MFKCSGVQYRWTCVQYRSSGVQMYRCSDWHMYLVLLQQRLHEESSTACTMSPTTSSLSPPHTSTSLHGAVLKPPELAAVTPELTGTPDMTPPPQTPGPGCCAASTGRPPGPPARPHTSSPRTRCWTSGPPGSTGHQPAGRGRTAASHHDNPVVEGVETGEVGHL